MYKTIQKQDTCGENKEQNSKRTIVYDERCSGGNQTKVTHKVYYAFHEHIIKYQDTKQSHISHEVYYEHSMNTLLNIKTQSSHTFLMRYTMHSMNTLLNIKTQSSHTFLIRYTMSIP